MAVNLRPTPGPYGGGNAFLTSLVKGLEANGHTVVFQLTRDVDAVLIVDPRWRHPMRAFSLASLLVFLVFNPRVPVIHRINECDERKSTRSMNKKLRTANYLADATIFVASWLTQLDLTFSKSHPKNEVTSRVIINGSNEDLFHPDDSVVWESSQKMKIVTHHWSPHPMKGLNTYLKLDGLLDQPSWAKRIHFTYIGNLPSKVQFKNSKVIPPLFGEDLGRELRSHHVYISASINEPGGNHSNEGALSGLPLIYLASGCLPEYCKGYGLEFMGDDDLERVLESMLKAYENLKKSMPHFPNRANRMVREYEAFILEIVSLHTSLDQWRKLIRNPFVFLRLLFPL